MIEICYGVCFWIDCVKDDVLNFCLYESVGIYGVWFKGYEYVVIFKMLIFDGFSSLCDGNYFGVCGWVL